MAFEKNHPKLGGRKAGTPNKITVPARETVRRFVEEVLTVEELANLYHSLKPVEKAVFAPKILAFIVPKMQHLEVKGEVSQEQAEAIINYIAAKHEDQPSTQG